MWVNVSTCYKMYCIRQRVFPLTVDSLLNPRTLSIAFVKLINYYGPKISNENPTYISYKWLKYTYFCLRYSFKPSWKTFSVKMCDIIRITDAAAKIWIHIRDWFLIIHVCATSTNIYNRLEKPESTCTRHQLPKQSNMNSARRHKINEHLERLCLDRGFSLSVTV